jgi:hypothetical protein
VSVFCDVFQKCVDNKCVNISDKFPVPTGTLIINGDEFDLKGSPFPYTNPNILFDNWVVVDGEEEGLAKAIVSPPNVLLSKGLSPITCPGGSFDVISLYMTPLNSSNLLVTLVGTYRDNQVGETVTLQLGSSAGAGPPIQFESQLSAFRNIDKLTFTPHFPPKTNELGKSKYFVMDDLTINIVSPCNMSMSGP